MEQKTRVFGQIDVQEFHHLFRLFSVKSENHHVENEVVPDDTKQGSFVPIGDPVVIHLLFTFTFASLPFPLGRHKARVR
jgi:hypothetical protein